MYSYDESSSCFEPVNFCKKNGSGKVKKKGKVQGQMDACMATKGDQKIHATFPLAGQ